MAKSNVRITRFKNLKIASVNTRGMCPVKVKKVLTLLHVDKCDIVFLQEIKHLDFIKKFGPLFGDAFTIVVDEYSKLGIATIFRKESDFRIEINCLSTTGMHAQSISVFNGSEPFKCCNVYVPRGGVSEVK